MCSGKVIKSHPHRITCQIRTAIFASYLRCDCTLPFKVIMPTCFRIIIWIQPPHKLVASIRHHLRSKITIFCWMPLGGCFRMCSGKVIISHPHRIVCQVWTTVFTTYLCCDRAGPLKVIMTARFRIIIWIQPPYLLTTSIRHHLWCKFAILCWVPLCRYLWMSSCEIVKAYPHRIICQIRTAVFTFYSCYYRTNPFKVEMTPCQRIIIRIQPPHVPPVRRKHLIRSKATILRWMPLSRYFWVSGRKIIESRIQRRIGQVWATVFTYSTVSNFCSPFKLKMTTCQRIIVRI